MTPCCNHIDCSGNICFEEAQFDSIYKGQGQVCTKHAQLETELDG